MNEKPKVSVIIPSYNAKERLEGSLFSLTLQETDIPFEVIVADNGSTDGTMEMLENIEVNFPFKRCVFLSIKELPRGAIMPFVRQRETS